MKYACYILLLEVLLTGCEVSIDSETVPLNEQIYIYSHRVDLKADGKDTTLIIARLPKDADLVDVSFATSSGTFIYSGSQTDRQYASLVSGNYRYAQTILRAGSVPSDSVYVTAEVTQARNRANLTFR